MTPPSRRVFDAQDRRSALFRWAGRRLILEAEALPGRVHVKNGRSKIESQIQGYNRAAQFERWLVLGDLDRDECPASLCARWLPEPARLLCFRVAVRAVSSLQP